MLLAALLPNVSYMGHWPIAGADVHLEAGVDPASVIAEHEAHCHIGPANCGGGESMVGTPFAGEDNGVLSLPGSEMKFDAVTTTARRTATRRESSSRRGLQTTPTSNLRPIQNVSLRANVST